MTIDGLRINSERLWARHMEMAEIGAIAGGGCRRLALSHEDARARDLFAGWCRDAGLEVIADRAGNMFAIRAGRRARTPMLAAGSHLDTQPHGGRFDGISGVLAALEVLETLNDAAIETEAPLAAVNWTNEEGVRFTPGLLGSSWFTGQMEYERLAALPAGDGPTFAEALEVTGWNGRATPEDLPLAAFLELHIEQGPTLEAEGAQVGVVASVQGLRWLDVAIEGTDGHAGTTPMDRRQDALLAGSRIVAALADAGRAAGPDARVSVGRMLSATNGPSTIAGRVDLVIDVRHPNAATLDGLAEACTEICRSVAQKENCAVEVRERVAVQPQTFDTACVEAVDAAAGRLGYRRMRMSSGALHDASNIATITPTAMIFVPCRDGISHNVREYAAPDDLAAGTNVLLHALLSLDSSGISVPARAGRGGRPRR